MSMKVWQEISYSFYRILPHVWILAVAVGVLKLLQVCEVWNEIITSDPPCRQNYTKYDVTVPTLSVILR